MTTALLLALCGTALLIAASPVRGALRDGWRCVLRYPLLWRTLAWLGFANALFVVALRASLHARGLSQFTWGRAAWHDPALWLRGSPDSVWWLPGDSVREALAASWLPALEALAGLFHLAVITFPVAALAALGFLLNRHRHRTLLRRALRRRFGRWAWLLVACAVLAALAVLAKAVLYFYPPGLGAEVWYRWVPVVVLVASAFELLYGLAVQVFLLLHAYAWVRGISFEPEALREVALRRFVAGAKWAVLVLLAGLLLVELPLVLKNFPAWQELFPDEPAATLHRERTGRTVLALVLLLFASMQAWLTLHGETLRSALAAHWAFVRREWWALLCFLLIAALAIYALAFTRAAVLAGLGEKTALGTLWTLLWPLPAGLVTAWLLAAWVCFFKSCERGESG